MNSPTYRQYIGARYVPKFFENSVTGDSTWASGTEYEPLTIVTWNQNNYISKKTVPSTVGTPNLNGDYWAVTGTWSAQIHQLQEELARYEDVTDDAISDIEGDISALDNRLDPLDGLDEVVEEIDGRVDALEDASNRKFLFVGDSFAVHPNVNWITVCAQRLGLSPSQYHCVAAGGYGFRPYNHELYWIDLVRNDATIPNDITDIVIGGGTNDCGSTGSDVIAKMAEFDTYVRQRFTNLRNIYLSFDSVTYISNSAFNLCNDMCAAYVEGCAPLGWHYLAGTEYVMLNPTLIDNVTLSDKVHPNDNGGYMLGYYTANAIKYGSAKVTWNNAVNVSIDSGLNGGTRTMTPHVLDGTINLYDAQHDYTNKTGSALTGFFAVYHFTDLSAVLPIGIYTPIVITYGSTQLIGFIVCTDLNTVSCYIPLGSIPNNQQFSISPWTIERKYR